MEDIPKNHLGCILNPMDTGISTTSTGAEFLPSTVGQDNLQIFTGFHPSYFIQLLYGGAGLDCFNITGHFW